LDERELRALALACQRGEAQAFRELVESLTRTLIAQAFRYTRDWEWARDLTQETWIRVHRRIDSYNPDRSFRAWLYAVHRNGCLSHVRKSWVKRELTPGDDEVRGAVEVMSEAADPEEDLERREFHRRLLTAMERLSESQRQVFVRVDVEQQEPKKVAQELGIKNGTLRATLHFARKRLAAVLRETEEFS
jgi:RNA polymerase sigma-70 factor (ECF subfamily)